MKKLKGEDLNELNHRNKLINEHILIVSALQDQKNKWLSSLFPKYNLDKSKQYNITGSNGKIEEVGNAPENSPEPAPENNNGQGKDKEDKVLSG